MQIKNITYGMTYKGYKNYRECLNMLERLRQFEGSEIAKERLKIIEFYKKYGEKATKEAYGADRKVISRWRKRIKEGKIKSAFIFSFKNVVISRKMSKMHKKIKILCIF